MMKISELDDSSRMVDLDNFFNVYEDKNTIGNPYFLNLNSTVYFKNVKTEYYDVTGDMFWTTISHKLYETPRLWWVLMKANDVKSDKIFDIVPAGTRIKYVPLDAVSKIVQLIGE